MISKQAVTVSVWSSLESTLLLHQYMETQKWTNAINSVNALLFGLQTAT